MRWLFWLEGTGHRTRLAVQQQRLRQKDPPTSHRLVLPFNQTQRSNLYPAQPRQASSIPSKNGTGTESCSHRYFDLAGSPVIRWGWHSLASWLVLEGVDVSPRCRVIAISNQNQARNLESR